MSKPSSKKKRPTPKKGPLTEKVNPTTQTLTIAQAIQLATQYHQSGELQSAEVIYRQVLQADPQNSDALHGLGIMAGQMKNYEAAVALFQQAISIDNSVPAFYYNLGLALQAQQQWEEAIKYLQRVLELNPTHLGAHQSVANILKMQGKLEEAVGYYRRALALNPNAVEILNDLGTVLNELNQFEEATTCFERVLTLNANAVEAHKNLGIVFYNQGKYQAAADCYQHALTLNPKDAEVLRNLGRVCYLQSRFTEATDCFQRALVLNPSDVETYRNLGILFYELGHYQEAIDFYQRALIVDSKQVGIQNNLGSALMKVGKLTEAITCFQQALSQRRDDAGIYNNLGLTFRELGKIQQSLAYYRQALEIQPLPWVHDNLLLTLNYAINAEVATIFSEHQQFNDRYGQPNTPPKPLPSRNLSSRLKIGYLSADFYSHAVAHVVEPILAHHDHQQFEIFCYYNKLKTDDITVQLQQHSDHWQNCTNLSDEALTEQIRQDQIDILIDLSGHTGGNRLLVFVNRPAPVQVTYLGYPNTTGLTGIDYRITDNYVDPAEVAEQFSSETLIRLPGSYFCYSPLVKDNLPVTELPATKTGYITFGSLNGYYKLNSDVFTLWAKVLTAVSGSKLLVKTRSLNDPPTRQALLEEFARLGISAERLLLETASPSPAHLTTYNQIDIALDSFPFTGGITTFEALWMGVPVVTLVGERHVARQGLSILSTLGLTELIAYSPEEYLQICIRLATDINYLQHLRKGMRERMQTSPLMDGAAFTRNLEAVYKTMWETFISFPRSAWECSYGTLGVPCHHSTRSV